MNTVKKLHILIFTTSMQSIFIFTESVQIPLPTTNANTAALSSQVDAAAPSYQAFGPLERYFSPQAPGFNTPDDNPKMHGIKTQIFKPENLSTGPLAQNDLDTNTIGYFWNTPDKDPSLIYPGKARIGNDQFINVVAIDDKQVDHTNDENDVGFTDDENIFNQNSPDKKKFKDDFLVKIGSFVKNGKTYDVFGQYMATVIPDPENSEYPANAKPGITPTTTPSTKTVPTN